MRDGIRIEFVFLANAATGRFAIFNIQKPYFYDSFEINRLLVLLYEMNSWFDFHMRNGVV
ncbi:hypothetical protein A8C56_19460 [Niabella ginsenosidivorans]|uniref:Uncharacterized protein n=1 Tax=Niabella ginsenosidivorans TaxID=1176587 RepID=A0A1A9I5N7_9BACT|nr:hypothetical protein A8C56_19460 [Niabella ginsenosidivorans]